jgi:hypothetical protein
MESRMGVKDRLLHAFSPPTLHKELLTIRHEL